jgi:HSP20 family protein
MSTMIRWEPSREIPMLRHHMDRLFNEMLGRNGSNEEGLATGAWIPQVDVFETPDSIVLKADLPGVTKDDVEISIQNSTLTLKGERKMEQESKDKQVYRLERSYGTFSRSFTLPPIVDTERANADFANGVLTLTLPRREESKPKQIKVKVN